MTTHKTKARWTCLNIQRERRKLPSSQKDQLIFIFCYAQEVYIQRNQTHVHSKAPSPIFHQSPTIHSDYIVTGKWWYSHCCWLAQHGDYIVELCSHCATGSCQQLHCLCNHHPASSCQHQTTPSLSSHCAATTLSRWLMEEEFCCVHYPHRSSTPQIQDLISNLKNIKQNMKNKIGNSYKSKQMTMWTKRPKKIIPRFTEAISDP